MLTVYSKANCPQCVTLKSKLELAGITYSEVRVDLDATARTFLLEEGHRSVPKMYLDGKHVKSVEDLK